MRYIGNKGLRLTGRFKAQNENKPTSDKKQKIYSNKDGEVSYKCQHNIHSQCTMVGCGCTVCNHPKVLRKSEI